MVLLTVLSFAYVVCGLLTSALANRLLDRYYGLSPSDIELGAYFLCWPAVAVMLILGYGGLWLGSLVRLVVRQFSAN